jgi:hypothetical protein
MKSSKYPGSISSPEGGSPVPAGFRPVVFAIAGFYFYAGKQATSAKSTEAADGLCPPTPIFPATSPAACPPFGMIRCAVANYLGPPCLAIPLLREPGDSGFAAAFGWAGKHVTFAIHPTCTTRVWLPICPILPLPPLHLLARCGAYRGGRRLPQFARSTTAPRLEDRHFFRSQRWTRV